MIKPGTKLPSIDEAAAALGVAAATLRHWHCQGRLLPALRTVGGNRRYASEAVPTACRAQMSAAGKTICYASVSSHDQSALRRKHGDCHIAGVQLRCGHEMTAQHLHERW
ncbi:MerR family DNA-binding transcriptional regulator [Cupriavidus numazuensis]|uniref:MerR family DNA-binding transcriptional regulator n=1 Tax=Cupriavidus numazuensis TaxID=221992 RepID=UPI00361D8712